MPLNADAIMAAVNDDNILRFFYLFIKMEPINANLARMKSQLLETTS